MTLPADRDEPGTLPLCHCIPQTSSHRPAFLIANEEGLLRLRDAIDLALAARDRSFAAQMFAADGEGYQLIVRRVTSEAMDEQVLGYIDPIANSDPKWPKWMHEDIPWVANRPGSIDAPG